jgi:dolichol kinase
MSPHDPDTIVYWIKFFSPAYILYVSLSALFVVGILGPISFIQLIVYSTIAIAIAVISQERFPNLFPYLGRNAYHSLGGILIVVVGMLFIDAITLVLLLCCVFLLFLVGAITEMFKVETMFSQEHVRRHVQDFSKSSHYVAGIYWLFSCIVLLFVFNVNIAFASILVLAVGDTSASFLGRRIGKVKNPLNHKKTVEGTLAFFSTSLFVAMLFVPTPVALSVAFFAAIIEALPLGVNDNLVVPLSTGVLIFLLGYVV